MNYRVQHFIGKDKCATLPIKCVKIAKRAINVYLVKVSPFLIKSLEKEELHRANYHSKGEFKERVKKYIHFL